MIALYAATVTLYTARWGLGGAIAAVVGLTLGVTLMQRALRHG